MSTDLSGFLDGVDYPMFVVTARRDGDHAGCLVGFATQVSIEPARFLVGLSVANHTYDVARDATTLAVHLLARRSDSSSRRCSVPRPETRSTSSRGAGGTKVRAASGY